MIEARSAARRLKRTFQATAAAATLFALAPAPAVHAQGLFNFFNGGPSPYDIERRLDAAGYTLTGPLIRRGDVYLADVVYAGRRDAQRLVIDVDTGRIVQRYRVQPARWRDAPRDWNADEADGDGPGPRPPADLDDGAPRQQASRDENPALGTGAPRTTGADLLETPSKTKPRARLRPHEAKSKSAPPVAKAPAPTLQNDASVGPAATAPSVAPPPTPAIAPLAAAPAAKSAAAPAAAPATVTAKTEPPAAPKSAPTAEPAESARTKSKAVNDLPVTPLD